MGKGVQVTPDCRNGEGRKALEGKSGALQMFLVEAADKGTLLTKRDCLVALLQLVAFLSQEGLHFTPSILSEAVISAKEVDKKVETTAFDLLIGGREDERGVRSLVIRLHKWASHSRIMIW